jgi:nicotinamidase-related amidase
MTRPCHLRPARPFDYRCPGHTALVVIDMQRDFIEPGGFGASLGNDVTRLLGGRRPAPRLLAAWRARGWPVLHTRECHRPDLADCPPAKRDRGPERCASATPGPWAGCWSAGEPGADIMPRWRPLPGEWCLDKPGKGAFWARRCTSGCRARASRTWCSPASPPRSACRPRMREANDRGYECLLVEDATESYFPAVQGRAPRWR